MRRELGGRPDMLVRGSLLLETTLLRLGLKPFMPFELKPGPPNPEDGGLLSALQLIALVDDDALWPPELPSRLVGRKGLPPIIGEPMARA